MGSDFSQFALSSAGHLNSPNLMLLTAQAVLIDYAGRDKKGQVGQK